MLCSPLHLSALSSRFSRLYQFSNPISKRYCYETTWHRDLKGFGETQSLWVNLIPPASRGRPSNYMPKYCKVELGGATQLIRSCIIVDADSYDI